MSAPIPVFSDRPKAAPTPKLRALVKFPGNVEATTGISVEKVSGTWTFELDYSQFATTTTHPVGPSNYILTYDSTANSYILVPSSAVDISAKADKTYVDAADALRVLKTGDTMSGSLTIANPNPVLFVDKSASGGAAIIAGRNAGIDRWLMFLGDATAESGGNAGSDFDITRLSDAGSVIDTPFFISRSSGKVTLNGDPTSALHAATKQYADTKVSKAGDAMTGSLQVGSPVSTATVAVSIGFAGITQYGMSFRPVTDSTVVVSFSNAANSQIGTISTSATITAYNTSSDVRLKENLQTFDAGRIVDDTEVYSFTWKSTGERSYGVSAQQANQVYPEAVTYIEKDDWYGVDYSKYVPVLLQELKALRARVAELEGKPPIKPS